MRTATALLLLPLSLTGCAGTALTGLPDAQSSATCPAPKGAHCMPMGEAYRRSLAGGAPTDVPAGAPAPALGAVSAAYVPPAPGMPLRSAAMQMRVWIAPWEDQQGALHDQAYVYVQVHSGRWVIDAARERAAQPFRRVSAPLQADTKPQADAAPLPTAASLGTAALALPGMPGEGAAALPVAPSEPPSVTALPAVPAAVGGEDSAP